MHNSLFKGEGQPAVSLSLDGHRNSLNLFDLEHLSGPLIIQTEKEEDAMALQKGSLRTCSSGLIAPGLVAGEEATYLNRLPPSPNPLKCHTQVWP